MLSQKPDSPVYTYIPKLKQPMLSDEQYKELVKETEAFQDNLSNLIEAGKHAMSASSFGDAINAFSRANRLTQNDPFVLQQLALATYKFKKPTELEALHAGLAIIKQLLPDDTNDPETLGITGAIHKRLWLATKNATHLDFAIQYYNRGYEVRRDYYNGENLALCHDYRSTLQDNAEEKIYDRICARKTREAILASLIVLMNSPSFDDRSDKKWIYATAANCCFALGNEEQGMKHENQFFALLPAEWEITTYRENKTHTLSFINQ
ncbi:TRAFs-binding domain-containing protein [Undibacterium sp. SXout20W]|uniref:TRAFs-binding domain-containing protein n=1 Tax=Undibacterium sp. SXout20W TaxID=3413051 RepID=UPI003BF31BB9